MKGKKIYIAGKITGLDDHKEKFAKAEEKLQEMGAIPMNPAVMSGGFTHAEYLYICFAMIDICEGIYFLNNWTDSPGAKKEFGYATVKKKQMFYE